MYTFLANKINNFFIIDLCQFDENYSRAAGYGSSPEELGSRSFWVRHGITRSDQTNTFNKMQQLIIKHNYRVSEFHLFAIALNPSILKQ